MKFFRNGPDIPKNLLEDQDNGKVVFICGAGVSKASGLPDFIDLTKHIIDHFHPLKGSEIRKEFSPWLRNKPGSPKTPLDQIYERLYEEYGESEVHRVVAEKLRIDDDRRSGKHELLLKISSDKNGQPQIVTTNFDHLLERGPGSSIDTFCYPDLPNAQGNGSVTGITYLHGRLKEPEEANHNYVLSSTDLGHAYVSDGRAARFICRLARRYTIVFIGYKAEDPPMKYLLWGLKKDDAYRSARMYAFDKGDHSDIKAKWSGQRVVGIGYDRHHNLWKTMRAWAGHVADLGCRERELISIARRGPRDVAPHNRGQVAHLVNTKSGAKIFAGAAPSLPAEWLCVFDVTCRIPKERFHMGEKRRLEYALENEFPRPDGETPGRYPNFLGWQPGDGDPTGSLFLELPVPGGFGELPPNLDYLKQWIGKSVGDPMTIWWMAGKKLIHPQLLDLLRDELEKDESLDQHTRRRWSWVLEFHKNQRGLGLDDAWREVERLIEEEGWTEKSIQRFKETTDPFIKPNAHPLSAIPGFSESQPREFLGRAIYWETVFPINECLNNEMPEEKAAEIFEIVEQHMYRAIKLMEEAEKFFISGDFLTCYPGREVRGERMSADIYGYFDWFLDLFHKMLDAQNGSLKGHVLSWPKDDRYFFGMLYLYALSKQQLFTHEEAGSAILDLSDGQFWRRQTRRELLFLIKDRWKDFPNEIKAALFKRILDGDAAIIELSEEDRKKAMKNAVHYARWMQSNGILLPEWAEVKLETLISKYGLDVAEVEDLTIQDHGGTGFGGPPKEDPEILLNLPIKEIIPRAKKAMQEENVFFTEIEPFSGLVERHPEKALEALAQSARDGEYPDRFWRDFLRKWPSGNTNPQVCRALLLSLQRLTCEFIRKHSHGISSWVQTNLKTMLLVDEEAAWTTFDHIAAGLASDNGSATASAIGERYDAAGSIRREDSLTEAINSPVGNMTQGCLEALQEARLRRQDALEKIKGRIEKLLDFPGAGWKHAVAVVSYGLKSLYMLDPDWTTTWIVPALGLDGENAHVVWGGYFSNANNLLSDVDNSVTNKLFAILKPCFLRFASFGDKRQINRIAEEIEEVVVEAVLFRCIYRKGQPDGITKSEAHSILRAASDSGRQKAITCLKDIGKERPNGWTKDVAPFIRKAWPREVHCNPADLSCLWIDLLCSTGPAFTELYEEVRAFLIRPEQASSRYSYFMQNTFKDGNWGRLPVSQHPGKILEFLDRVVPDDLRVVSDGLANALNQIKNADEALIQQSSFIRLSNLLDGQNGHAVE